jgi:hypothetical protein
MGHENPSRTSEAGRYQRPVSSRVNMVTFAVPCSVENHHHRYARRNLVGGKRPP